MSVVINTKMDSRLISPQWPNLKEMIIKGYDKRKIWLEWNLPRLRQNIWRLCCHLIFIASIFVPFTPENRLYLCFYSVREHSVPRLHCFMPSLVFYTPWLATLHVLLCAHCAATNQLLERLWRFPSSAPPPWYTIIHLPTFIFCNEWQTSHRTVSPLLFRNWFYKRKNTLIAALISCSWIQPSFPVILYSSISPPFISSVILLTWCWHHCCFLLWQII